MRCLAILSVAIALALAGPAAAERFQVGEWQGRVAAAAGAPAQCGAVSRQAQGTTLTLAVAGDNVLQVTAGNPNWVAPIGRSVGIILAFDDRARQSAVARVVAAGMFRLEIEDRQGFAAALRSAQRLQIYSSGAPTQFRLDNVPAVLDRLAACAGDAAAAPAGTPDDAQANRYLAADPERGAVRFLTQPAAAAAGTPRFAPRWPMIQRQFSPMAQADTRGSPLSAADVERLARQSIYLLWVDRGTNDRWTSVGSAVAVANDTLLTNCHVVRDSRRLALRQGTRSAAPTLLAADDGADRCFIRVEGMTLTPVSGVRAIASLQPGEAVYSLGNPGGRDRIFGKGAITGMRQREGVTVIQTSAPMAPGSSGGGLFDAWGNLVGVTSFALYRGGVQVGRYAIAAEEFWR